MGMNFQFGSRVILRKPHPCGSYEWRVERLGVDIGIRCLNCGHYIVTTRQRLSRNAREILEPSSQLNS